MKSSILFGLILLTLTSAYGKTEKALKAISRPGPAAIVYKTKADYSKYVPITLSDDKNSITSYPAPQDVFTNGGLAMPTALPHGYLLDNRGIGPNSVFIKMTYEEYSRLTQQPSQEELFKLIIDKDPFTEMYDLGLRNKYKGKDISNIVKKHKLKEFKKLI